MQMIAILCVRTFLWTKKFFIILEAKRYIEMESDSPINVTISKILGFLYKSNKF